MKRRADKIRKRLFWVCSPLFVVAVIIVTVFVVIRETIKILVGTAKLKWTNKKYEWWFYPWVAFVAAYLVLRYGWKEARRMFEEDNIEVMK